MAWRCGIPLKSRNTSRVLAIEHGRGLKMNSNRKIKYLLGLGAMMLILSSMGWGADDQKDRSDIDKRIEKSGQVLEEIMATPDKAIPDKVMSDSTCIAVVPSMIKIAVGMGG